MLRWASQEDFLKSQYIKSHSFHSRHFYEGGLKRFKVFLEEQNVKEINNKNVYDVLNAFVLWNDQRGLRGKTINGYLHGVKKFLLYNDFKIEENRLKAKVSTPRNMKIEDQPLTIEKVRRLLTAGKPNKNTRALILVLLSSGMRLAEALSLKIEDVDLESHPVRARIRAAYSKTKRDREVFISDEAREAVKEILYDLEPLPGVSYDNRKHLARLRIIAQPERYLFKYGGKSLYQREKVATVTFVRVRKRAGLGQQFEDYKTSFGKIHFHLFRKFFLTKGSDTIGEHAAHALCGHGFYMDTYYRKSEEERAADYLKLMPRLTVFGDESVSMREVEVMTRKQILQFSEFTEQEIEELGDLSKYSIEDLKELDRKKESQRLGLNGHSTQKIIPWSDVRQAITDGWELVSKLEDTNEAIVRLPK